MSSVVCAIFVTSRWDNPDSPASSITVHITVIWHKHVTELGNDPGYVVSIGEIAEQPEWKYHSRKHDRALAYATRLYKKMRAEDQKYLDAYVSKIRGNPNPYHP